MTPMRSFVMESIVRAIVAGAVHALKGLDDDTRQRVREAIDRLNGIAVISPVPKGKK